ncbi:APC family permease [Aquabacter spiritensis]|uniref:Amino acid/polyamine/organocation transporter (APC superfamily) n=1 Tax=Aquabacter spiritensis TaxID=933073 RepID=A0A4R3M148_9HYPH|nr:amino acid permease [Aquabacter spiritensis]TCT06824.1 amino acid/polyamine/organocation transporter (APC superfamily) [Aquabacter spiritensis]
MPKPAARREAQGLSVIDGVAVMVGIIFGIGIFKTPPLIAANVGSEAAFVAAWLLGGLVTLAGALCYAELAAAHPDRGGEYHFLSRAYGPRLAVLFAWARGTVIQTGAIAAVAFVYGDYANALLPLGTHGPDLHAAIAVIALTALNVSGTRRSSLGQRVFTLLTLVAIVTVAVAGFLVSAPVPTVSAGGSDPSAAFGMAMVLVLLTYGGWSEAVYLSGEMRDVQRSMTRTLVIGTIVVVAAYGLFNIALLNAFGLEGLRATTAPAADLMSALAGGAGETVIAIVVCVMAVSTLNGTVLTGARAFHALGSDVPMLGFLCRADLGKGAPVAALLVQGGLALVLIVFGAFTRDGFSAMVDFTAPVFWGFLFLVSLSLFLFRWREPDRARPFRVPLYPVTPLLFSLACAGLLYASLAYTGVGALVGVAVVAAGLPLLFFMRRDPDTGYAPRQPAE